MTDRDKRRDNDRPFVTSSRLFYRRILKMKGLRISPKPLIYQVFW